MCGDRSPRGAQRVLLCTSLTICSPDSGSGVGRTFPFRGEGGKVRNRRISVVRSAFWQGPKSVAASNSQRSDVASSGHHQHRRAPQQGRGTCARAQARAGTSAQGRKFRLAVDSPLEGTGFEPAVPRPRSKTCASGSRHLLVPAGSRQKGPLSGNAAGDPGHGFGQLWEKWRVQSRLASLQPQTFCDWPMAILATAMPAARPLPCLHRKPFATGILCAAAWQFNYLFGDRILTEVEPLPSPSLRDGEWPPLTSNFTDLTIN